MVTLVCHPKAPLEEHSEVVAHNGQWQRGLGGMEAFADQSTDPEAMLEFLDDILEKRDKNTNLRLLNYFTRQKERVKNKVYPNEKIRKNSVKSNKILSKLNLS